jgi:hypothetical protein
MPATECENAKESVVGELSAYLRLLGTRGASIACRELASRLFREDPVEATRRVMAVCERHGARFTFFIVGVCARDNPAVMEEILSRGHEIACHGYFHKRFAELGADDIRRDLDAALTFFQRTFGYRMTGFRAPYLDMADHVYAPLAELGFVYSSSVEGAGGAVAHPSGIVEIPIAIDDWAILIRDNGGAEDLAAAMGRRMAPQACFLLHPWRVGQRRFVGALEQILENPGAAKFTPMNAMLADPQAVALSGDIGELSWLEIAARSLIPAKSRLP